MPHRLLHVQPLRRRVLAGHHDVHVVPAAQTVIHYRQQAVGIGRQVDAHDRGLLVHRHVDEAGVLVGEAVVILPPDVGRQQVVEGCDLAPPLQGECHLEPLGVLVEHRIDDVREGLVGVEEAVPAGQQVSLEPSLALVLTEDFHHAAILGEEFISLHLLRVPLSRRRFKDRVQPIRQGLVRPEDAEVALILILPDDIPQECPQHARVLRIDRAGRRHLDRILAAVGVRVRPHPPRAARR